MTPAEQATAVAEVTWPSAVTATACTWSPPPSGGECGGVWDARARPPQAHPPLARFLTERSGAQFAQFAQVTDFGWGATSTLPFLPRLRSGRVVLAPARWRLAAADLPARNADWEAWDIALGAWCCPPPRAAHGGTWSTATDGLPLREHLNSQPHAVLNEAPDTDAAGWCEGRAHEIVASRVKSNATQDSLEWVSDGGSFEP